MRKAFALGFVVAAFGCGGVEPPPKAPEPPPPPPQKAVPLVAKASSELGSVDPATIKRAFAALDDKYMECQKKGLDRVEVLAGNVKFFVRIGPDGGVKWAYLEESDVGDRDTEKCLLDVVSAARWPKPDTGDAEVRYSMELPLQSTRPPNDWSADKVATVLGKSSGAFDKCKAGATGTFRATMYVAPGGKVLSAGIATPVKDADETADCLAKTLLKMKGLPSPGSWPAKVSFGL